MPDIKSGDFQSGATSKVIKQVRFNLGRHSRIEQNSRQHQDSEVAVERQIVVFSDDSDSHHSKEPYEYRKEGPEGDVFLNKISYDKNGNSVLKAYIERPGQEPELFVTRRVIKYEYSGFFDQDIIARPQRIQRKNKEIQTSSNAFRKENFDRRHRQGPRHHYRDLTPPPGSRGQPRRGRDSHYEGERRSRNSVDYSQRSEFSFRGPRTSRVYGLRRRY